jgi:hypothetical protein
VIGPLVFGSSSFFVGSLGYAGGFLYTDSIRSGLCLSAVMEALLILYLIECVRTTEEEK